MQQRAGESRRSLPATTGGARAPDFLSTEEWSRVVCALGLTKREGELMRAACYDESQRAIAEELDIAEHTVHTHWHNVFAKLGVHSVAGALSVFIAAQMELRARVYPDFERPRLITTAPALGDAVALSPEAWPISNAMTTSDRDGFNVSQHHQRKAVAGDS